MRNTVATVFINSRTTYIESLVDTISYERLCLEVGIEPKNCPMVTFYAYGISASIEPGECFPLINKARYSVIPRI